jgi:acyl-CoA thioester hydrolase
MMRAFLPDSEDTQPLKRQSFPASSEPPQGVHRCWRRVHWGEIDGAQHVNNAVYFTYLEDCENEMLCQSGWSAERTKQAGLAIVTRNFRIEYLLPALMDDVLEIATWVTEVRPTTAVRHYTIHRSSNRQLLTRAQSQLVWVDTRHGRPVPIPAGFFDPLLHENLVR